MVCVLDTFLHLIPFFSHLESKLGHIWLRGDVRHHLAVLLSSLLPIFVPDNSARKNPNTSGNPQHLDLLPVLPGTLSLPPPSSPFPLFLLILEAEIWSAGEMTCLLDGIRKQACNGAACAGSRKLKHSLEIGLWIHTGGQLQHCWLLSSFTRPLQLRNHFSLLH